jgi:hypothetical protein
VLVPFRQLRPRRGRTTADLHRAAGVAFGAWLLACSSLTGCSADSPQGAADASPSEDASARDASALDGGHGEGAARDALDAEASARDAASSGIVDAAAGASQEAANGSDGGDGGWWKPAPGATTWQWQLSGTLDTSLSVGMYDIDMFTNDAAAITALQARHVKVVCYVDVGTYEPGRPDSSQFPAAVLGSDVQGWPGEKWLDVTSPVVKTIMEARFALAHQKGCDGVEPDNVDSYQNAPGFPTTAAQQATFDTWVASSVHALGMAVALKNDTDQVAQLEPLFDFELDEQCFQYAECSTLMPFIRAGKAVFEVEYGDAGLATSVCPTASSDEFDTLIKDLDLDAWRVSCQ